LWISFTHHLVESWALVILVWFLLLSTNWNENYILIKLISFSILWESFNMLSTKNYTSTRLVSFLSYKFKKKKIAKNCTQKNLLKIHFVLVGTMGFVSNLENTHVTSKWLLDDFECKIEIFHRMSSLSVFLVHNGRNSFIEMI